MRDRLLQLRADIQAAVAASQGSSQVVELDQSRLGRLSRMDAMQVQAMSQASDQRRELSLRKITAALARIDNDDFGYCQSCDEAIARKRLEFDPTAVLCIACASSAEQ
jgi:DnaK suppressor protein